MRAWSLNHVTRGAGVPERIKKNEEWIIYEVKCADGKYDINGDFEAFGAAAVLCGEKYLISC